MPFTRQHDDETIKSRHTQTLTCHDCGHEGGEHDEEDGEEDEGRIIGHLEAIIADIEVEQSNQYADYHMCQQTQSS